MKKSFILLLALMLSAVSAFAQNKVSIILKDAESGAAVDFATVTLSKSGAKAASYASLTNAEGVAELTGVKSGTYVLKAELLGYKAYTKTITVNGNLNLGKVEMKTDKQMLNAASVSAVGNPITIKKDTIEYNASSFRTTDNDVLEDLLKKLPGVEVSEDGSITVNGETIKKITIDGKTFFLDDPQLASKNIPAKAIEKLKVIEKKSEQAEFTGIDDGEEEHVIDLSIKKGMMNGLFGNVMAGGGHDIPASSTNPGDWRYQGAGFVGKFSKGQQISAIVNINNTNNRGFNDLAGSMMQGMRGGGGGMGRGQGGWGGGNGITTSYMAGLNGVWDLLDNKMELGGNYLFNGSNKYVTESSEKRTYLGDYDLLYNSNGENSTNSYGHRFGVRMEHKFSENTSIIFEPQVNFGGGGYVQNSETKTNKDDGTQVNDATINNIGSNKNVSTSGFLLFRQRLGMPGRTLTAMARYSFSNNDLSGENHNTTNSYDSGNHEDINQFFNNNQRSSSIFGRATYTEPLGGHFYLEGNYSYRWAKSTSDKDSYSDPDRTVIDYAYTNNVINTSNRHQFGLNAMYQVEKFRAQLGVAATCTNTYNNTTKYDIGTGTETPMEYRDLNRWKFSPQAMLYGEFSENANGRLFYRGSSEQPSTSQLVPVPDLTDPLNISFGNPALTPYFSHNLRGDFRVTNKKTFFSFNIRFNASMVEDAITNLIWYGGNGAQYSMPMNGRNRYDAGFHTFLNTPIAKSNFSISNMLRMNYSSNVAYVGKDIDMTTYENDGYYPFMEEFSNKLKDDTYFDSHITENITRSLGVTERLRFTYRNDFIEANISGRTRINSSWYSIKKDENTLTFNNQIRADATWNWNAPGMSIKGEFNYNWYNGYATAQKPEYVLNLEISKLLLKKKMTIALKGYDILGQAKNLTVTDTANYHQESLNNTLGRYIILSLTYRFGTFDRSSMRMPGGGRGMGGRM